MLARAAEQIGVIILERAAPMGAAGTQLYFALGGANLNRWPSSYGVIVFSML